MSLLKRIAQKMNSGKLDEIAKKVKTGNEIQSRGWARKIIERHANGEPVEFYALKCAREVLEMDAKNLPTRERQPGDEGDE